MKLKVADKWKWLSVDGSGAVFVFELKPEYQEAYDFWDTNTTSFTVCVNPELIDIPRIKPGKESLHKILKNGTLERYTEDNQ